MTLLIPNDSKLPIVQFGANSSTNDPRRALKAHYLDNYSLPVAVRPAFATVQIHGQLVSLHRCSAIRTGTAGFTLANTKDLSKCAPEFAEVAAILRMCHADGSPISGFDGRMNRRSNSNSKRV